MARVNLQVRPDLPWSAPVTLAYFGLLLLWLNGSGPPRRSAERRRQRLRFWPPQAPDAGSLPAAVPIVAIGLMAAIWIAISRMSPIPDLSAHPTTAYRWSMFLMGGLTAGILEEMAFRGYMQTGLERFDRENAIWITSAVFVAAHLTHGIAAVAMLGPGIFIASVLYGHLARRTGTILPGMILHVLGDLAHTYFGSLHGDGRLLFVG